MKKYTISKSNKHFFTTCLIVICSFSVKTTTWAQIIPCGTSQARERLLKEHPELLEREESLEKFTQEYIKMKENSFGKTEAEKEYIIPVVFHVLHQYGSENISDAQIMDQMRILNEDYSNTNPDTSSVIPQFKSIVANCHFKFRLATKDPNGNCTNGIDRIYTFRTNNGDQDAKLNQWDRKKYLNIWVTKVVDQKNAPKGSNILAYAHLPGDVADYTAPTDGIIILSTCIGSIGTANPNYSRTLTHEVGHYLNLQHPWGGTNSPEVACDDDGVSDTPITRGKSSCNPVPYCSLYSTKTITYKFDSVSTTTGTEDPTPVVVNDTIFSGKFKATGVSSNSMENQMFSFNKWGVGAADSAIIDSLKGSIDTSKYFEITLTPHFVYSLGLKGISFKAKRSVTGPRTFAVRTDYLGGSFSTNLSGSLVGQSSNDTNFLRLINSNSEFFFKKDTTIDLQNGSNVLLNLSAYKFITKPFKIRIYAWNAEDTAGTFAIDDFKFDLDNTGYIENYQNYMDYSFCSNMFTVGQKLRMEATLNNSQSDRNNLWTAANLAATGTDDATYASITACVPKADFSSASYFVCRGTPIQFSDASSGTVSNRSWAFSGGSPALSSGLNPTVSFSNDYWQPVSLTVSNNSGSDSKTKYNIFVSPPWTEYSGSYSEGFEDESTFNSQWIKVNRENEECRWQYSKAAAYSGTGSLVLKGYHPPVRSGNTNPPVFSDPGIGAEYVDQIVSPSFDFSRTTSMNLTFKYSCATYSTKPTESLKVYYSINCGQTWAILNSATKSAEALANAGYDDASFIPNSTSKWAQVSIAIPPAVSSRPNVRFMFEYTSGPRSNNLYIDDINISGTVGLEENFINANGLSIYPNPLSEKGTITYTLLEKQNVKMELFDVVGRKVNNLIKAEQQNAGDYEVTFNVQSLDKGVYFIKASFNDNVTLRKLIVN